MRVKLLEEMARTMVGDGQSPNLYFETLDGNVVTVTASEIVALLEWRELTTLRPLRECVVEDRQTGTICSVAPESDEPGAPLRVYS